MMVLLLVTVVTSGTTVVEFKNQISCEQQNNVCYNVTLNHPEIDTRFVQHDQRYYGTIVVNRTLWRITPSSSFEEEEEEEYIATKQQQPLGNNNDDDVTEIPFDENDRKSRADLSKPILTQGLICPLLTRRSIDNQYCCRLKCTKCDYTDPMCISNTPCPKKRFRGWRKKKAYACSLISTLRVRVAYTDTVLTTYGLNYIQGITSLAIKESNQAYLDSRVPIRLVLDDLVRVPIMDYFDSSSLLRSFQNGGYLNKSNVAVLLSHSLSSCGRAYLDVTSTQTPWAYAYAVVHIGCATGYYSFAHEIGHLQGLDHNKRFQTTLNSRFEDNHGYVPKPGYAEDGAIRSIMAYPEIAEERMPIFSNPDIEYMGYKMGDYDTANNARVLRVTRRAMSSIHLDDI